MKLTSWNAEWLDSHWGVVSGAYMPGQRLHPHKAPTMEAAERRIAASVALIELMAPDILFLCEGPKDEGLAESYVTENLPEYTLIRRPANEPYHVKGRQGLWFIVKKIFADKTQPSLLPIATWRDFASRANASIKKSGRWSVAIPRLETFGEIQDVPVSTRVSHGYFRHPQTLVFRFGGMRHEVIGAHLKSKFTGKSARKRHADESFDDYAIDVRVKKYLAGAHAARVKLSSEATNIRAYIDQRFDQESDPSIFVVGDLNDGPGKELMEQEYLLHDLISNLQGEVFFARHFLNHALFDAPQNLRWTAFFQDKIDPTRNPNILLDHILFTQALTNKGTSSLHVGSRAGQVEHLAFEEIESEFGQGFVSDHRPVSVHAQPRGAGSFV